MPDWTISARNRVATAWHADDLTIVAYAGTSALDTSGALPVRPVRMFTTRDPGQKAAAIKMLYEARKLAKSDDLKLVAASRSHFDPAKPPP